MPIAIVPTNHRPDPEAGAVYRLLPPSALPITVILFTLLSSLGAQSTHPITSSMKSVYVINLDRPDQYQIKSSLEQNVLKAPLNAYIPHNQYLVCLSDAQLAQVRTLNVHADLLPVERRLAPGLEGLGPAPNTELILELCDNSDRDLNSVLNQCRPTLDQLGVEVVPVGLKRFKASILPGTTARPADISRSLLKHIPEIIWIEKKSNVVLL